MHPILDDAGSIPIDTAQLIAHTLVQANSGGGKTVACRRILEQTFGAMPQWVIDPEGEMHTLRERHPHLLAAPHGGDTVASVKTAPLLARRLLETGASCVIDIYDLGVDERHAFVRAFAEAAMNQPRTLWRDVLVVIDESHRFAPERGEDASEALGAIKNWLTAGRKRGYAMILAVQRLSTLHKSAAAECNNRLIGRTGLDTDQDRAGKALGLRRPEDREALARLKPGRFWVYGPAFCERPTEVQIGEIHTSHGKSARGKAATPPLEEARKYLAQIGDLPAEAEAELKTVEQLKARVKELEAERNEARGEISRMTTRPADDVLEAQRAYDRRLDEMQAERDNMHTALKAARAERAFVVKQLADQLKRVQAGYREQHAAINKVAPLLDHLASELESAHAVLHGAGGCSWSDVDPAGDRALETLQRAADVVDRPWSISTADEIISDIAKNTDGYSPTSKGTIRLINDDASVSATSRINGQVGPRGRAITLVNGLSDRARALLTVLAQRGRLSKGKAVIHSGYGASGKISDAWAELAREGLIVSQHGDVEITQAGRARLGPVEPLPSGPALLKRILARMDDDRARKLLQIVVAAYPGSISKGEAVKISGYGPSGKISDAWAYLSARDYIISRSGEVTAAKELCVP